jgi:hypothetical protein
MRNRNSNCRDGAVVDVRLFTMFFAAVPIHKKFKQAKLNGRIVFEKLR